MEEQFIFPLGTVLFPGARLPLQIFEQRYLEMTKTCLRDSRPFGVCLIREGREVGVPAVPEAVGCLAAIEHWEMPQLGLFRLLARGGDRFRLLDSRVAKNGLITGTVERLPPERPADAIDPACQAVLKLIIERVGESTFTPVQLEDASWVGFRLAELLPMEMQVKQQLLELTDPAERLARIRNVLTDRGLLDNLDRNS